MLAALVCGLFYGAFFLWIAQRADERKQMDRRYARGMERLRTSVREFDEQEWGEYVRADTLPYPAAELAELDEGCLCDECCDCGDSTTDPTPAWYYTSPILKRRVHIPPGSIDLSKVIHTGFEDE